MSYQLSSRAIRERPATHLPLHCRVAVGHRHVRDRQRQPSVDGVEVREELASSEAAGKARAQVRHQHLACVALAFDRESLWTYAGGEDGKLRVWDDKGKLVQTLEAPAPVQTIPTPNPVASTNE